MENKPSRIKAITNNLNYSNIAQKNCVQPDTPFLVLKYFISNEKYQSRLFQNLPRFLSYFYFMISIYFNFAKVAIWPIEKQYTFGKLYFIRNIWQVPLSDKSKPFQHLNFNIRQICRFDSFSWLHKCQKYFPTISLPLNNFNSWEKAKWMESKKISSNRSINVMLANKF